MLAAVTITILALAILLLVKTNLELRHLVNFYQQSLKYAQAMADYWHNKSKDAVWQSKYHTLRLENNALRKALYQQNKAKVLTKSENEVRP